VKGAPGRALVLVHVRPASAMSRHFSAFVVLASLACTGRPSDTHQTGFVPTRPIEVVLAAHTPALMRIPGVTGTAQSLCAGAPCIHVLVIEATPDLRRRVPERIEGYAVELQVTGMIRPRRDTV
jgi:hypothetical protein